MYKYPQLAGDRDTSVLVAPQLFMGDAPIVTDSAVALADIQQWQLCVILPTGIKPYVVADDAASSPDKLVVSQIAGLTGARIGFYSAGKFNHEVMVWPASITTFPVRRALVAGSMIHVDHAWPPSA